MNKIVDETTESLKKSDEKEWADEQKWFRKFRSNSLKRKKSLDQVAYIKDSHFDYVKEEMLDKIGDKKLTPEEIE
jgi:hypothetical protein